MVASKALDELQKADYNKPALFGLFRFQWMLIPVSFIGFNQASKQPYSRVYNARRDRLYNGGSNNILLT